MKRHLKRYFDIVFFALAPGFLKRAVKRRGEKRYLKQISERMKRTRISKEEVDSVFDEMQLGCDVMFHTSTMNIGKVAGGTKFLAERIEKTVDTSKHTLLLSALPVFVPACGYCFRCPYCTCCSRCGERIFCFDGRGQTESSSYAFGRGHRPAC